MSQLLIIRWSCGRSVSGIIVTLCICSPQLNRPQTTVVNELTAGNVTTASQPMFTSDVIIATKTSFSTQNYHISSFFVPFSNVGRIRQLLMTLIMTNLRKCTTCCYAP